VATAVARHALYLPGRLIMDPTDFSAAAPYGGTRLGLTRLVVLRLGSTHKVITAEEWGNQAVEVIHGGTSLVLGATLRAWDADALAAIFLDTAEGDPSGERVVKFRADAGRAGTQLSTKAMKLLFVPRAVVRQPSIYIRQAVPVVADDAEIMLAPHEQFGISVVFYAIPDTNEDVAEIGRLTDLTL